MFRSAFFINLDDSNWILYFTNNIKYYFTYFIYY
nr:MAG TPA: hypothetical protein [Bacteriophage sp.]